MVCVGSILLVILGLFSIFAKDLMWEMTVFFNRTEGVASERTPLWDVRMTVGGIISIILGLVGIVLLIQS